MMKRFARLKVALAISAAFLAPACLFCPKLDAEETAPFVTRIEHGLVRAAAHTAPLEFSIDRPDARGILAEHHTGKAISLPKPSGFFIVMLAVFTLLGGRHLRDRSQRS